MGLNIKKNKQGFTLIELLAVVVIMGILMIVAIQSVNTIIANTRKDTMVNIAKTYISAVRNEVLADNIKCGTSEPKENINGLAGGKSYYFEIKTSDKNEAQKLLETVGHSPYGNANIYAIVKIEKDNAGKYSYSIDITDDSGHGTNNRDGDKDKSYYSEAELVRKVFVDNDASVALPTGGITCVMSD